MSSLLLAVHGYNGTHEAAERHYPYWLKAGADKLIGIGTTDGTRWPDGMEHVSIGRNSYIDGTHLPQRLIDTMRFMLLLPYDRYVLIEWDVLFFQPMVEFTGVVGFLAGNRIGDMECEHFYHVPWGWDYESGQALVKKGQELIDSNQVSGHQCSPDIFFSWVAQEAGIPVTTPWIGFTRNTIETAQDAEDARNARLAGAMAIHGCKTRATLDYIMA